MAKKSSKRMGRPKLPEGRAKVNAHVLRLRPDQKEWLGRLLSFAGDSFSEVTWDALKLFARKAKFPEPPPDD